MSMAVDHGFEPRKIKPKFAYSMYHWCFKDCNWTYTIPLVIKTVIPRLDRKHKTGDTRLVYSIYH